MCCILFYILIALVVLIWIAGFWIAYNSEKKSYNNGKCPCCGNELKLFDTDSQGGRGYECPKCDYTTWVSYDVDKNYKQK